MDRTLVLDIPYGYLKFAQKAGARWNSHVRCCVWRGNPQQLPVPLTGFEPAPFSWGAFVERQFNKDGPPRLKPTRNILLRGHQKSGMQAILKAVNLRQPGFLLADEVGLGKTITAWAALLEAYGHQELVVVIVAPLSVLPGWEQTLQWMGTGNLQPILINYDRLRNLFNEDDAKGNIKRLKGVAQYAKPRRFHLYVWDESHNLKNLQAARTKMALKLYDSAQFHLWMSATAGQTPLELGYLLPLLHHQTKTAASGRTPDQQFESWCKSQRISVAKGSYSNWAWEGDHKDCHTMRKILFGGNGRGHPGALRRRPSDIQGWPELQRILMPVQLGGTALRDYLADWRQTRAKILNLPKPKQLLEVNQSVLRLRQKASLLRAEHTADAAAQFVQQGRQVAISLGFLDSLQAIQDLLEKRRLRVAVLTGSVQGSDRKGVMDAFNTLKAHVILFTVTEGINLQRGAALGKHDTRPRIQIDHDIRWSALQMHQIDGRCHRDGEHAPVYWAYAKDTYEHKVGERLLQKLSSLNALQGDKEVQQELLDAFLTKP